MVYIQGPLFIGTVQIAVYFTRTTERSVLIDSFSIVMTMMGTYTF